MCGIVGFRTNRDFKAFKRDLPEGVARLSHRGPDDSGLFFAHEPGVGLGHRRLSILDLSRAGRQPMESEDGRVVIAHNGEIYNFLDMRKTLQALGHGFKSDTDTEVALKAYLQWGPAFLERCVGMFALAIWDGREERLILARDRMGIKPLYYGVDRGNLVFASELKALMAFELFQKEVDPEALPLYLHYQYVPAPRTIFARTWKLLPGHYLVMQGDRVTTHAYWRDPGPPEKSLPVQKSDEAWVDEWDALLTQAVSERLVSDVPLGALLSGGIDSSLVVAVMQKVSPRPIRTFSIGFDEKTYDEAPYAAKIAAHLGTDHTELYVDAGRALEVIPRLPEIYDEPFADSSAIPTHLVCSLARSHLSVALSGDGGDEQFAGYVRYGSTRAMGRLLPLVPEVLRTALSLGLKGLPLSLVERVYASCRRLLPGAFQVENFPDKWQKFVLALPYSRLSDLYRVTVCLWSEAEIRALTGRKPVGTRYEEAFSETRDWPALSRFMKADQRTYLPDAMLTKVDRASMAVNLEVRVPLLDHRVVEFAWRLPEDLKYRDGSGKYLLKKALSRYVPAAYFERPKMGFGAPIGRWFRQELRDMVQDYLSPRRLRAEGLFDAALVERRVREHLSGRANHQHRLWALLMWEMWREHWLKNPW